MLSWIRPSCRALDAKFVNQTTGIQYLRCGERTFSNTFLSSGVMKPTEENHSVYQSPSLYIIHKNLTFRQTFWLFHSKFYPTVRYHLLIIPISSSRSCNWQIMRQSLGLNQMVTGRRWNSRERAELHLTQHGQLRKNTFKQAYQFKVKLDGSFHFFLSLCIRNTSYAPFFLLHSNLTLYHTQNFHYPTWHLICQYFLHFISSDYIKLDLF